MTSSPLASQAHLLSEHTQFSNTDMATNALIASAIQALDQRPPPSMHEILAAFTTKGDGDREMLFALLNAKAAEDNRIAAERNLRRSLLEMHRGPAASYSSSMHIPDSTSYPLPSPPTSFYRDSPHANRRSSLSPSVHSSEDAYSEAAQQPRKRRRSRSPIHEHRSSRRHDSSLGDAPLPPSPSYSASSSQGSIGSPRSREAMTIGSLLSSHERSDIRLHSHNVSFARRGEGSERSHS